jgi:hypothetical protein
MLLTAHQTAQQALKNAASPSPTTPNTKHTPNSYNSTPTNMTTPKRLLSQSARAYTPTHSIRTPTTSTSLYNTSNTPTPTGSTTPSHSMFSSSAQGALHERNELRFRQQQQQQQHQQDQEQPRQQGDADHFTAVW